MSKSRVYQFYKNMGMRKNKNEKTEFAKRMELFGGDESPKDPKEQQAQEFRKFMRQNCPALQKAEKIRRNQVSYFERRMAYNQKYHKMSLIDKYLEARKRSSKYKRRLEGSIFRCRRVQNDAKNTKNRLRLRLAGKWSIFFFVAPKNCPLFSVLSPSDKSQRAPMSTVFTYVVPPSTTPAP